MNCFNIINKKIRTSLSPKAKYWTVKGILEPLPETGGGTLLLVCRGKKRKEIVEDEILEVKIR